MEATEQKSTAGNPQKKDVYAIINDRIIEQLEKGTIPWRQPWTDAGIPRNLISKRPYRGINVILLSMLGYEHNLFLTHNQLQQLGGAVRTGERPHMAVFWNFSEVSRQRSGSDSQAIDEGLSSKRKVAYLRYYLVYNIAQCSGIPGSRIPAVTRVNDPIPLCEEIADKMPQRPLIRHGKEQAAYYDPLKDYVNMPKFNSFESAESYYGTLFHELVHSTGHSSRLNRRDLLQMQEYNKREAYSHEELVAEIGSCYLLSFAGVTSRLEQSADYIRGWLTVLRNDKRFLFSAATAAQKATDFILNLTDDVYSSESNRKPDIPVGLLCVYRVMVGFTQSF